MSVNSIAPCNSHQTEGNDTSSDSSEIPPSSIDNTTTPNCIKNSIDREDLSDLSDNNNNCDTLRQESMNSASVVSPPFGISVNSINTSTGVGETKIKFKRGRRPGYKYHENTGSVSGPFFIPLRDQISEISRTFREQSGPPYRCPLCLKVYFSYSGVMYHLRNNTHSEAAILENRKKMARGRRRPKTSAEGQKFAEVEIEEEIYRLSFEKMIFFELTDVPPSPHSHNLTPKKSKICPPKQTSPTKNSPKTLRGQYSPEKGPPPEASFCSVAERDHIQQGVTMPLNYIQYIEKTPEDMALFIEYEMDEEDIAWLSLINNKRRAEELPAVSFDTFELVMDNFEKVEREWH